MSNASLVQSGSRAVLSVAEEETPNNLPAAPTWYTYGVTEYPDFGATYERESPEIISPDRQPEPGSIVDFDAVGGFSTYFTTEHTRLMQSFLYADAREVADTAPLNGTAVALTSVDAGDYSAASGLGVFSVGALVFAQNFTNAANNGLSLVTGVTATDLTTDSVKVVEAAPPSNSSVAEVGREFSSGDLVLASANGLLTLTSTGSEWADSDIPLYTWVFIGGDAATTRYDSGTGYGRVVGKTDDVLTIDELAWVPASGQPAIPVSDAGTGKTIRVFYDKLIRSESDANLFVCRSHHLERTLGEDANGTQSQIVTGAFANELAFTTEQGTTHKVDFGFVALNQITRTGTDGLFPGNRENVPSLRPFNTSTSVFRQRMSIVDAGTLSPTDLFSYVSDANITIANNVTAIKAVGVKGGFDVIIGDFDVTGTVTPFFERVDQLDAIPDETEVNYNAIYAQENRGIVYDIPRMELSDGSLSVARNDPITSELEVRGVRSANNYTFAYTSFRYLPDVAMPV